MQLTQLRQEGSEILLSFKTAAGLNRNFARNKVARWFDLENDRAMDGHDAHELTRITNNVLEAGRLREAFNMKQRRQR